VTAASGLLAPGNGNKTSPNAELDGKGVGGKEKRKGVKGKNKSSFV
jgi:hypothetical protein